MPIASFNIRFVPFKQYFLLTCWEVKDSSSSIISTRYELHWTQWEWQISNASLVVSWELILLTDLVVWVYDITFFVTTDQVFLIVAPTHGLYSVLMNWCAFLKLEVRSIPNYNLTTWSSSQHSFPTLHPLNGKESVLLFVFLLSQELWTCCFPISAFCVRPRINVFPIRCMRKDCRPISDI